jgi:hypothetical protein
MAKAPHKFCTYFDRNYLVKGQAMIDSLHRHAGSFELTVLCLDEVVERWIRQLDSRKVRPITLAELEAWEPRLPAARADRTRVEYYWTCTPSLVAFLLEQAQPNEVVSYLDADLYWFGSPQPVYDEFGEASILIHEHRYSPAYQHSAQTSGIYNVGLIAFRNDTRGLTALRWWQTACIAACYLRPEEGYCGDQKYLDDWPTRFTGVHVLQHLGAGLAPWNMDNYRYTDGPGGLCVSGAPLIFYHFHALQLVTTHLFAQRGHNLPAVVKRRIYQPYVVALRAALGAIRGRAPGFSGGFAWPPWRSLVDDLRHGRALWI